MSDKLATLVREFFNILEAEEETADGRVYNTTTISSSRATTMARLNDLLSEMKRASRDILNREDI